MIYIVFIIWINILQTLFLIYINIDRIYTI